MKSLLSKLKNINDILSEIYWDVNTATSLLKKDTLGVSLRGSDVGDYHNFLWIVAIMLGSNSKRGMNHLYSDIIEDYDVNLQEEIVNTAWQWAQKFGTKIERQSIWVDYYQDNPHLMVSRIYDGKTNWRTITNKAKGNPRDILKPAYSSSVKLLKFLSKKENLGLVDKELKTILVTCVMVLHNNVAFDYFSEILKKRTDKQEYYKNIFYDINSVTSFRLEHIKFRMKLYDDLGKPTFKNLNHIEKLIGDLNGCGVCLLDKNNEIDYDVPQLLYDFKSISKDALVWIGDNFKGCESLPIYKKLLSTIKTVKKILESDDVLFDVDDSIKINIPLFKLNLIRQGVSKCSIDIEMFSSLINKINKSKNTIFKDSIFIIDINSSHGVNSVIPMCLNYPKDVPFDKREKFVAEVNKFLEVLIVHAENLLSGEIKSILPSNLGNYLDDKKIEILSQKILLDTMIDMHAPIKKATIHKI